MRLPVSALLASLLSLCAPAIQAQQEPTALKAVAPFHASQSLTMELKNARWFDGKGFQRGSLFVVDGQFVASRPAKVHRHMELRGQYLVPPLAEAHNHNLQNQWGWDRFAQRYIQDGVFYTAMLCGDPSEVDPLRPLAALDATPDTLFVTACITSSDGHPLAMLTGPTGPDGKSELPASDFIDKAVIVMDNPQQVRDKWQLVMGRKTDLIKVVMSYSEHPELHQKPELRGKLGVDAATLAAIVRKAHESKLRVAVHVDSVADFEAAVNAGADQIAHLPGYFNHHGADPDTYLIPPELARRAAQARIQVITTTAATQLFQAEPERLNRIRTVQQQNLRQLKEAGVALLLGSDVFTATALAEWHSLDALKVLEPAELLRIATVDTPRALFPQRRLGCFEPGCEASFLVLAGNPLEDAAALDLPLLRVKRGRILTQSEQVAESTEREQALASGKAAGGAKKKGAKSAKGGGKNTKAGAAKGKSGGTKAASKPTAKSAVKKATASKR